MNVEAEMTQWSQELCRDMTKKTYDSSLFTTEDIERSFSFSRTQASRLANQLVDNHVLFKINTRPVLFGHREMFQEKFDILIDQKINSLKELSEIIDKVPVNRVFEKVIGFDKSLAEPIEQLKTAVYYPENGLPVIVMGDTGIGKSFFVQIMYEYMVNAQVLSEKAPFKILNCAQYYNNPELLSGLLFGFSKGAFTGAYENKSGLLEDSDGGLLFLDEVHRLSAEGQEKLFTFMDKGTFSRIGESKERKASVRLAFATTEKKDQFLQTFLRRIPITIYLPNLSERTILEKKEIITKLFQVESKRLDKQIVVSSQVMFIYLNTIYSGNIGEIENAIKYACGSAISRCGYSESINITIRDLPSTMYSFSRNKYTQHYNETEDYIFDGNKHTSLENNIRQDLDAFTQRLNQIYLSQDRTASQEKIRSLIDQQVVEFIDRMIFSNSKKETVALEEFVIQTMQELFRDIEYQTFFQYDGSFVLFVSHYIYKYMLRSTDANQSLEFLLEDYISQYYAKEKQMLKKIFPEIERRLDIHFDSLDLDLFSLFFSTQKHVKNNKDLDGLIIAHGFATASSIANVCNRMLGGKVFTSFDMPIEASIHDISAKVEEYIRENNTNKGLIILIDMGSLNMIYDLMKKTVSVPVLCMDQLGTLMALEIGNMVLQGLSIGEIAERMKESNTPNVQLFEPKNDRKKAIITTCFTGIGTAIQIQKMLSDCLDGLLEIEIFPMEYNELIKQGIPETISQYYDLLGIVGTDDPSLTGINFTYLENIISGENIQQITETFGGMLDTKGREIVNDRMVKNFSLIRVLESLTILDTQKIMELIEVLIVELEERLSLKLKNARKIGLYVHISCMIERLIRQVEITEFSDLESFVFVHQREIKTIKDAISVLETTYSVQIPLPEICYIHNILFLD
ncbi:sigma 54-interacting transcriptional regulator [Enterococcus sp. N342-3-1-2]